MGAIIFILSIYQHFLNTSELASDSLFWIYPELVAVHSFLAKCLFMKAIKLVTYKLVNILQMNGNLLKLAATALNSVKSILQYRSYYLHEKSIIF